MESEKNFIVSRQEKKEQAESPKMLVQKYIYDELRQDLDVFTDHERKTVLDSIDETNESKKGQSEFDLLINRWWFNKYGFPYENKTFRSEVIMHKYAEPEMLVEQRKLQEKLLETVRGGDVELLYQVKTEYEKCYPDQLEGVTSIFELPNVLKMQEELEKDKIPHKKKMRLIEGLTQFQFLLTHFIDNNEENKDFLKLFWETFEQVGREANQLSVAQRMRQSAITQAAALKTVRAVSGKATLSHPREDAFSAIDMWVGKETAVQVKGTSQKKGDVVITPIDTISFPAVQEDLVTHGYTRYWSTTTAKKLGEFRLKVDKYGEMLGKKINGYAIIIPNHKIDFITGVPQEDVLRTTRDAIKKIEESNSTLLKAA